MLEDNQIWPCVAVDCDSFADNKNIYCKTCRISLTKSDLCTAVSIATISTEIAVEAVIKMANDAASKAEHPLTERDIVEIYKNWLYLEIKKSMKEMQKKKSEQGETE